MAVKRLSFRVIGRVQGVGYRYFARDAAIKFGVSGWAANRSDGSVEGEAEGEADAVDEFARALEAGPPGAYVEKIILEATAPSPVSVETFEIRV